MSSAPRKSIAVINPLPAALEHYALEVSHTCDRVGFSSVSMRGTRPVESGGVIGRTEMLKNMAINCFHAHRSSLPLLQLWPSAGYLEILFNSFFWTRPPAVVFHDPVPIRPQPGCGRVGLSVGRGATRLQSAPTAVTHSEDASVALKSLFPARVRIESVLHPIANWDSERVAQKTASPSVLVAGQYKPTRDIALLEGLGERLARLGVSCEIAGRGWPTSVRGWSVTEGFLTEAALASKLSRAWVVLVPYSRFYQSGIAVRALELGTLAVLPESSFGTDLFDDLRLTPPAEATVEEWLVSLVYAIDNARSAEKYYQRYRETVDRSWLRFLERW